MFFKDELLKISIKLNLYYILYTSIDRNFNAIDEVPKALVPNLWVFTPIGVK